jgi:hypothetical protein
VNIDASTSASAISCSCPDVTGWTLAEAEAALHYALHNAENGQRWTFNVIRTAPPTRKPVAGKPAAASSTAFGEWRVLRWAILPSLSVEPQSTLAPQDATVQTVEIVAAREIVATPHSSFADSSSSLDSSFDK